MMATSPVSDQSLGPSVDNVDVDSFLYSLVHGENFVVSKSDWVIGDVIGAPITSPSSY